MRVLAQKHKNDCTSLNFINTGKSGIHIARGFIHPQRSSCQNAMDTRDTSANTTLALKVSDEEAVYMDTILAAGHLICVFCGMPINLIIILLIIVRRRLRRQPRNLIWIGIGFSNIFVLITNSFELIGYYLPEAEELCRIRFFLV